jgi:multiple sugar transport system ATP-binding protein
MTMGTRIVVMKDGFIQQVDSPTALYDRPVNLYVAGFIGSPQMNFINAKVDKRGSDIYLVFGKNEIKLCEEKAKKLEGTEYIGADVIVGVRPESLLDDEAILKTMPDSIVEARVEVVEMLGSETLLYLFIEENSCTARVGPKTKTRPGDIIKIAIDTNRLHIFDKDTEKTIIN